MKVPPDCTPVLLVPNVNDTAPPTPNVLLICVAPPIVVVNAILAAPATLIPPLGTTIAPVPCVDVAILAFAHRLFAALNVVNAPVLAVILPIGVLLIAANCARPAIIFPEIPTGPLTVNALYTAPVDRMLPVKLILAPVNAVPVLPINPDATLPNTADVADVYVDNNELASTLPATFI